MSAARTATNPLEGEAMSAGEPVTVSILDREYLIACTPDERPGLIAAAAFLDAKMREIRAGARSANLDRIAVLAALTIAHELLGTKQRETSDAAQLAHHLQAINAKLERALPASLQ
ncbi:MAG TPA: cell division protein ZapA [Rhodanobacteraceae bacterium]|jgi:cell division protein ZapA